MIGKVGAKAKCGKNRSAAERALGRAQGATQRSQARAGKAATTGLALLLATLAAGAGVLFWLARPDADRRTEASRPVADSPAPGRTDEADLRPGGEARRSARGADRRARDAAASARDDTIERPFRAAGSPAEASAGEAARFDGRGALRGSVFVTDGSALPPVVELGLIPSRTLSGSAYAEARSATIEVGPDGSGSFLIEDLGLGAYDVRASAPGYNSAAFPIVLERGNARPFVNLPLSPAGWLAGTLTNALGHPLPDVPLALERQPESETRTTRTDAGGGFHFDAVLDGPYRLCVGSADRPWIEPKELTFRAPSMTLPPLEVSGLATVTFQVVDQNGEPVYGVLVEGEGDRGGQITGRTDPLGSLTLENLPPGRYMVTAERPNTKEGRGRSTFELERAWHSEVQIVLP